VERLKENENKRLEFGGHPDPRISKLEKKNELALGNIKEPTNPPDWLESQMLSTCYQAIKYDPDKDLREKLRLNDAEGLKEIGRQINAINKLIRFSKTHKSISGSAFLFACARSNYRIPKEEVFSILPKLLEEYKKQWG